MAEGITESDIVSCFNQTGSFQYLFHASPAQFSIRGSAEISVIQQTLSMCPSVAASTVNGSQSSHLFRIVCK